MYVTFYIIKHQKDCASILGMSLNEYQLYCQNTKITSNYQSNEVQYDNSILKELSLTTKDLKVRRTN